MATIIRCMFIIPNRIKIVLYFKIWAKLLIQRENICLLYSLCTYIDFQIRFYDIVLFFFLISVFASIFTLLQLFSYFDIALKLSNTHGDGHFLSYIENIVTLYDLKRISCRHVALKLSHLSFLNLHHFRCGHYNTVKSIICIYKTLEFSNAMRFFNISSLILNRILNWSSIEMWFKVCV